MQIDFNFIYFMFNKIKAVISRLGGMTPIAFGQQPAGTACERKVSCGPPRAEAAARAAHVEPHFYLFPPALGPSLTPLAPEIV